MISNMLHPFLGAVSTTGLGECLFKTLIAKKVADNMEIMASANEAIDEALKEMTERVGGDGGAISISRKGQIGIGWNSSRMGWAYATKDQVHSGCNRGEDFVEPLY